MSDMWNLPNEPRTKTLAFQAAMDVLAQAYHEHIDLTPVDWALAGDAYSKLRGGWVYGPEGWRMGEKL